MVVMCRLAGDARRESRPLYRSRAPGAYRPYSRTVQHERKLTLTLKNKARGSLYNVPKTWTNDFQPKKSVSRTLIEYPHFVLRYHELYTLML